MDLSRVPVPDSGIPAALGYAEESGMQFEMAAMVVATAEEAQRFEPGTILRELPAGMVTTPAIKVVRR